MNEPLEDKVIQIVARTFRAPVDAVSLSKRRGEIPGWDSLGHLTLVMEIESELGLRFPMDKINELESIEQICALARNVKQAG
jgi:acyl carrier protein